LNHLDKGVSLPPRHPLFYRLYSVSLVVE
jgi:hypothetical protein